ncbi:uncharacterized protein O3C94_013681 [Discoglossus pictus]
MLWKVLLELGPISGPYDGREAYQACTVPCAVQNELLLADSRIRDMVSQYTEFYFNTNSMPDSDIECNRNYRTRKYNLNKEQKREITTRHLTNLLMMNKDKKILNHVLEILSLLTGEVFILQHPTNSPTITEMNKDKKKIESILNHTLEIIYLLTGEEYTIVKKNSPHSSIHQLAGEGDIDRHREKIDKTHQADRALKIEANRNSGLQDENVGNSSEEGDDEIDEKDSLQVTIHSELCAEPSNGKPSTISQVEQEELNTRGNKPVKEEEIPVNISEAGLQDEDLYKFNVKVEEEDDGEEKNIRQVEIHTHSFVEDECMTRNFSEVRQITIGSSDCAVEDFSISHGGPDTNEISRKATSKSPNISINTHKQVRRRKRPNVLSDCGKGSTSNKDGLDEHTGEKTFTCSECGKGFTRKANLVTHKRVHTGERPYACSDCGKSFSQASYLKSHKRIHTGEKPFVCSDCGKCFSTASHFQYHKKTHAEVRPYVCPICGKSFIQASNLSDHKKTHTGEKPFVCSDCGKSFCQKGTLVRHQRSHAGKRLFVRSVMSC